MKLKVIFLLRHGETVWNKEGRYQGRNDSPLTEEGKKQARKIAAFISDRNIECLYRSPLGRAMETANIIADALQCSIDVIPELTEMNFGEFESMLKEDIIRAYPYFFKTRKNNKVQQNYPSGESYVDVFNRVKKPLKLLLKQETKVLVIVGHESVNRIIRGIIEEIPLEEAVMLRQKNNEVIEYRFDEDREIVHEI
ncbi:MAG: histidine phosphatase family protein [Candidatus Aenigmarchaeota archaeon]|nr:histidine phosphatase family protein [Candidatus Aenigmarchaeota archaeon]